MKTKLKTAASILLLLTSCQLAKAQLSEANLLKNGDAEAGTVDHFAAKAAALAVTSAEEVYEGKHAFAITLSDPTKERVVFGTEFIPVSAEKNYSLSAMLKSGGSAESSEVHLGLACFTEDQRPINSQNISHLEGTGTELVSDAVKGDTVLQVKNADQWKASPNTFVAFDVDDSGAFSDLPNFNLSSIGIVGAEQKGDHWEIKLARPLSKSHTTGTKIRQHAAGNTYVYCTVASKNIPTEWKSYSGKVAGVSTGLSNSKFWPGTRFVKVVILPGKDPDQRLLIDNIVFQEE